MGMYSGVATLENSLVFPQKIKHRVTIMMQKVCSRYAPKRKENLHIKTCTQIFITSLFVIVKKWKPPYVQQLTNGQIKCGHYIQTMEYYLARKRNEVLITCYDTDEP